MGAILLTGSTCKPNPREQIILLYVRGYWLTRYLVENHSELIQELLSGGSAADDFEAAIGAALEIPVDGFWQQVDPLLVDHFSTD